MTFNAWSISRQISRKAAANGSERCNSSGKQLVSGPRNSSHSVGMKRKSLSEKSYMMGHHHEDTDKTVGPRYQLRVGGCTGGQD